MDTIYPILESLWDKRVQRVLATIIQAEGSAYRKAGASMLIEGDGSRIGMLSGGCLEEDLAAKAADILKSGTSRIFNYRLDAEGGEGWGEGAGCGGILRVLLEPVDDRLFEHLLTLKRCLENGVPVMTARRLGADGRVPEYLYLTDNCRFGVWERPVPSKLIAWRDDIYPYERRSGTFYLTELSSNVYLHHYWPKPRLIVFGAGVDARPLVDLAAKTGFYVEVADWRPAFLDQDHFPAAGRLHLGFPDEIWSGLALTPLDYVVIMTHRFAKDKEIVQRLLKTIVRYAGMLGNRRRLERLLDGAAQPPWLHSPAGLSIDAEGPEEIAVSIIAEVIRNYRREMTKSGSLP